MKNKIKVENIHGNSGPVKNQFVIQTDEGIYFQSYSTVIAFKPVDHGAPVQLDRDRWDYSRTTGKYRNIFLRESKAETEKKIANGTYVLVDQN